MGDRFVIAAVPRCGGGMIGSALASRPGTRCVLDLAAAPEDAWGKVWNPSDMLKHRGGVGCVLDATLAQTHGFWDMIAEQPDIRVIVVGRHNQLKRFVSEKLMAATGVGRRFKHATLEQSQTLDVDVDELRRDVTYYWETVNYLDELFQGHRVLRLQYEDVVFKPNVWFNRVQEFLGLEPCKITPWTGKLQHRKLSQVINNYHRLLKHIMWLPRFGAPDFERPEPEA